MTLDAVRADIDTLVAEHARLHHCAGVSWGVVRDGALVMHGAVGTADITRPDRPLPTASTVFRIASMTKSFTCAALLALRDDGVLSLADRIADLAPELARVAGPTADAAPITVGDLMSMVSGLATDDAWADRHLDITDDDLDVAVRHGVRFAHSPGTAYEYSNLGFGLLGRVVQRVTGQPVQHHITARLLHPLGMADTTWVQPAHDDWARPHRVRDGEIVPEGTPILGDGGIAPMGGLWTTVADLTRWVSFLDDAFPPRDHPDDGPLRRASRREMQRMRTFVGTSLLAGQRVTAGYGYGLRIGDSPTLGRLVTHAGGLPGYGSNMRWLQGRRLGAIALANSTYAPMSELTMRILMLLDVAGMVPPTASAAHPDLVGVAQRLVALLGGWDDEAARALFADNVEPDDPFDRRASCAAELVAACGGSLEVVSLEPDGAATATVHVRGATDTARIRFELAPLHPAQVQFYEITLPSSAA